MDITSSSRILIVALNQVKLQKTVERCALKQEATYAYLIDDKGKFVAHLDSSYVEEI